MRGLPRRLLVLAVLVPIALVADAATAEASGCFFGPYVQTIDPALGCPLTIIRKKDQYTGADPRVTIQRDDQLVDLRATVLEHRDLSLDVGYYETDCMGHVVSTRFEPAEYELFTLDIEGAAVLDQLWLDNAYAGTIGAPAQCADPAQTTTPEPSCSGNYDGCTYDPGGDDGNLGDDTEVGCMSAGAGSLHGSLAVLAVAFLVSRRRRRAASKATAIGVLALVALAPRAADASSCYLEPSLLSSSTPRLGCPVVIAQSHYTGAPDPTLRVLRDTDNLDVTGAISKEPRDIPMSYYQLDCDGRVIGETQTQTPYDVFTIELSSKAQAGDMLLVGGITSPIQPADPDVPCGAPIEPRAFCNVMADMCDYSYGDDTAGDDDVGCMNAGGGRDAGALVVLGLVLARRRRR